MKVPALFTSDGKVVTGSHHGDAFSKLTPAEQNGELLSGFIDQQTGKFVYGEQEFYLKRIILIRHAHVPDYFDPAIDEHGQSQCDRVIQFLRSTVSLVNFKAYASCCRRCWQSADRIYFSLGMKYECKNDFCNQRNADLVCCKSQPEEWYEDDYTFGERIRRVLAWLPEESIIIASGDFIAMMAQVASNYDNITQHPDCHGIPHGSITFIDKHHPVWIGRVVE